MTSKLEGARGLYLEGIRDGRPREAVHKYTGARYTQHSTGVRDGADGFIEFFEPFIARNPDRDIRILRAFEDGPLVFLHVYQSLNNGESEWVTMDFFDTDSDERIVEHWDVIVPYVGPLASGLTQIDGPTTAEDPDLTERNKALVSSILDGVIDQASAVSAPPVIATSFVDHGTRDEAWPGIASVILSESERTCYEEVVLLVGCGNLVATLSRASWLQRPFAVADLFRIADGRVVEHWDAAEPVPPTNESANGGKF